MVVIALVLIVLLAIAVVSATTRRPGEEETVPFDPVRPDPDPPADEP